MTTVTTGQNITRSVELLDAAGQEINNLLSLTQTLLSEALDDELESLGKKLLIDESWTETDKYTDSGWTFSDHAMSLPLYSHHKRNSADAYLVVQVSLSGSGAEIPGNPAEPVVHIYLTDEEPDLDEWVFTAMDTQEGDVHHGVLIDWNPAIETWVDQNWAYSLRLTSLNNLNDVRNKIVSPVLALLSTDDLASVSDSLIDVEGIVHYE